MTGTVSHDDAIGRAAEQFVVAHPRDAARHLERMSPAEVAEFLAALPAAVAGSVIGACNPPFAARCLAVLDPAPAAAIIAGVDARRGAAILRACPKPERLAILEHLDDSMRRAIRRRMRYEHGSAAFLADAGYPALAGDVTVREAFERYPMATAKYLYVCDREQHLQGVLSWADLAGADGDATLGSLMTRPVVLVSGGTSGATLRRHPAFIAYDALPVVDEAGTFIGAVTHKTLREIEEPRSPGVPVAGVLAAAELYWRGMGALLAGVAPPRETAERTS